MVTTTTTTTTTIVADEDSRYGDVCGVICLLFAETKLDIEKLGQLNSGMQIPHDKIAAQLKSGTEYA